VSRRQLALGWCGVELEGGLEDAAVDLIDRVVLRLEHHQHHIVADRGPGSERPTAGVLAHQPDDLDRYRRGQSPDGVALRFGGYGRHGATFLAFP
jgi:hypothetical protein